MDQVVVHLSLAQGALPRIHFFLGSLQTGMAISQITHTTTNHETSRATETKRPINDMFRNAFYSSPGRRSVNLNSDAHGSKTHLRLQPEQGTEMSAFVSGGDNISTASSDGVEIEKKSNSVIVHEQQVPYRGIRVKQRVEVLFGNC